MTGLQYITAAMRLCGILDAAESTAGTEGDNALDTLNRMLRHFSIEYGPIFSEKLVTKTLTVSTNRYTIGLTEWINDPTTVDDIVAPRPQHIISASIRRSSVDYPVTVIPWREYETFSDKSTLSGMPTHLAYQPSAPSGVIYLYPIPDAADSLRMVCQYSFQDMVLADNTGDVTWNKDQSIDEISDANLTKTNVDTTRNDYYFPPGYDEMIVANLAEKLAIEYGVPLGRYNQIRQLALDTKGAVIRSNVRVEDLQLDPRLPSSLDNSSSFTSFQSGW